ncbi:MAG: prepilin-type N-terminal cleavage/methylation domain-containing protein [Gammaproteobacteria bacterium]|nr:prepilin-type N-terminal cleavage/methylation domain-containing protein [Gammaproteobacteria bacterium]
MRVKSHIFEKARLPTQSGFTLIEVVMVVIISSVLFASVGVRVFSPSEKSSPFQAQRFLIDVRHIQALAMLNNKKIKLVPLANSYSATCLNIDATPICAQTPLLDPTTRKPFQVSFSNNVKLSGAELAFDGWGRPIDPVTENLIALTEAYTLRGGSTVWQVEVAPVTGFVSLLRL